MVRDRNDEVEGIDSFGRCLGAKYSYSNTLSGAKAHDEVIVDIRIRHSSPTLRISYNSSTIQFQFLIPSITFIST